MSEPIDPYGGQPYSGPPPTGYPQEYTASYPAPGYAQPAYGAYAPGYPPPGYPAPPPLQFRPLRPGVTTAAAVLGFVTAGLLIIGSLFLFSSAQFVHEFGAAWSQDPHAITNELSLDGVVNLCAAALLIPGGVMLTGGKALGQSLVAVGSIVVVCESVYWIIRARSDYAGALVFAVIFGGLAVAALTTAYAPVTRTWLTKVAVAPPSS